MPPKSLQLGEATDNWTTDEDSELVESATEFNQNWDLVSDCINTKRRHLWGPKRTAAECFLRLQRLQKDPKKFASIWQRAVTTESGNEDREETKRKLVNQFSVYDHVKRIGGIKPQYAIPPPPQKKVSLSAHDSHSIAASEAGVTSQGKMPSPNDLAQRFAQQHLITQHMQANSMMNQAQMAPQFAPQHGALPHGAPLPQQIPPHLQQQQQGGQMIMQPLPMGAPMHSPQISMQLSQQSPLGMPQPHTPGQPHGRPMGPGMGGGILMTPGQPMMGQPQLIGVQAAAAAAAAAAAGRGMPLGRGRVTVPFGQNPPLMNGAPGPPQIQNGAGPVAMTSPVLSNSPNTPYGHPMGNMEGPTPTSPTRMAGRGRGMPDPSNYPRGQPPPNGVGGQPNQIPMGGPPFGQLGPNVRGMMQTGPVPHSAMHPRPPLQGNIGQMQHGAIPPAHHSQQLQQQLQQLKQLQQLQRQQQQLQFQHQAHQQYQTPEIPDSMETDPPPPLPQQQQQQRQPTRGNQSQPQPSTASPQPQSPTSPTESPGGDPPKKGKGQTPKGLTLSFRMRRLIGTIAIL